MITKGFLAIILRNMLLRNIDGVYKNINIIGKYEEKDEFPNLDVSTLTKVLLKNRNVSYKEVRSFFHPTLGDMSSPFLLPDMEEGVERTIHAIEHNEGILVVGDYDVDGLSGTALLVNFFNEIGKGAGWYIPKREEGYGINKNAIDYAKETGCSLIIAVDNGTNAFSEIEYAKNRGIDVIVIDHHKLTKEDANFILINPQRKENRFPLRDLAAVGIAFCFIVALRMKLRERGYFKSREPNLRKYLDVVALGTMGDMVPLIKENRLWTIYGMDEIERDGCTGIKMLKRLCNGYRFKGDRYFSHILIPHINAAGRMDLPSLSVKLLTSSDEEESARLARKLIELNKLRQDIQKNVLRDIRKHINTDDSAIVLSSPHWHRGIVGLVANQVACQYGKPAVIISENGFLSVGSGRGVNGFNMFEAMEEVSTFLDRFGGHERAVGFTIKTEKIRDFADRFMRLVKDTCYPSIDVDCEIELDVFEKRTLREIARMQPFGEGNPFPRFLTKAKIVAYDSKAHILQGGKLWDAYIKKSSTKKIKQDKMYYILFSPQLNFPFFNIEEIFEEN